MGESNDLREVMERVVSATLGAHLPTLKDELIEHACEQLAGWAPGAGEPAAPAGGSATGRLNAVVNSLLECSTQADILGTLLDGTTSFAERAALFVIRGATATGWRAVGLENNEGIKSVSVEVNHGLAGRACHDRAPAAASAVEFDDVFVSTYGAPADGTNALVLPLVVRDKVAALIYADAGIAPGGRLDSSALDCLVRFAGLWLEIVALRRSGVAAAEPEADKVPHYAAPAPEPPRAVPVSYKVPAPVAAVPTAPVYASAAAGPATHAAGLSAEDEEVHKKARRFAKLLVDEIKLYNQAKVAEGRTRKDLYARLKDDIDKSRATYDKRYGSTAAAAGNYFTAELVHILANDDPSLLGHGFSG